MAKNFASIYNSGNDAVALEQRIFIKEEVTRGTLAVPADADFIYTINGAQVTFTQPVESSPVRSGRHHSGIIRQKTSTEWTLPTFFMVDTSLGAPSVAEIDPGMRVLYESLFGRETSPGGVLTYDPATPPNITFSIYNNGDQWAQQAPGAFVDSGNATFPGDGQAQIEFAGMAKTAYLVGVGKSATNNNAGNTVTVGTGEGERFPVGAKVMLIKVASTRSTDTPNGSARTVTSVAGDVVTLDGAVLADADGTAGDLFLCYYEPAAPTAINNPITGLVGSFSIVNLPTMDCVRSVGINMTNNHEPMDFCYGHEGLGGPLFTPGGRFTAEVTMELNLNHDLVEFINKVRDFVGEDLTLVLGSPTGRRLEATMPKVIFAVPEIPVPDTGTIPISFTGNAYQTAEDAADEVMFEFK
jgi:hypothetical protein